MILYQSRILRIDLKANPSVLYVFGDNLAGQGFGGQAKEMRDEPNAIGIPTKRGPHVYFRDHDFDDAIAGMRNPLAVIELHLRNGGVIVFPADGIGTGLANLSAQSPRIWTYLNAKLLELGIRNHG